MVQKVFAIAEFIYRFVALNVLWVVFCLIGLGIFGIMPATVALFSVVRQWIKGEKDIALFTSFFHFYKAEFVRSNLVGAVFVPVFYILYVNVAFVSYFYSESVQMYIYIVLITISCIVIMTFVNVFSVMAHFKFKTLEYIKVAAGLVFLNPIRAGFQLIWVVAYIFIAIFYPSLFIAIGISVFAYILMAINYTVFQKYSLAKGVKMQ
ncbi:hypothetical protein JCM9140_2550 [Halalkalibacter wakoensis JCM 9140]|uniref:YESV protein n=1 Tax=Halalkalibacter wakoensis JCM 9140 TaxID=1236970 RepID=W4Q3G6_9BACI|nr:DUF624 domain-containing protein [Halalkalibacter wakoensis]GAE26480.1 hypothetical protein JCM9140_2550 [Halalkalibacter wakoensis JCM 9140]